MLRPIAVLVAVLAVALAGVGLTFSASTQAPADFRFVNGSEPRTLDPALLTGQPGQRIADALFEGLTRRDPRTLQPVPGVAASWETTPDGLQWTFRLREDARWSDGRPVTAHDFSYAWRRLLEPGTGAEYAYLLHGLRLARALHGYDAAAGTLEGPARAGLAALRAEHADAVPAEAWDAFLAEQGLRNLLAEGPDPALAGRLPAPGAEVGQTALAEVEALLASAAAAMRRRAAEARRRFGVDAGVIARDDSTLVVELEAPIPYFLELTSFFSTRPVPRWAVEGHERDWFLPEKLVCNGPFVMESWRVNDRIRLRRSPTYWGKHEVALDRVDVLAIEQPTTALNLYLSGDVDWLPSLYPVDLVDVLRDRPDFYSGPGMIVYYYRLNVRRPPLDDPRVRRAIGLAIDRREITEEVLGLGQIPAVTMVPPGMPGYEAPESGLGFDPELARRLLAEAGYPGGRGLRELGLIYNTHEMHKKIAEVIADQLRRNLGIRVQAYNQEWQSYLSSLRAGEYDVARAGWIGDYLDPNTFLDIWLTGGGNNQTGWGDPAYDALIAAASDIARASRSAPALLAVAPEPERLRSRLDGLAAAEGARARAAALGRVRLELLRQAESILVGRGFPVIPIYFYVVSGLLQPRVEGFYSELELPDGSRAANLQDLHPLRDLSVRRTPGG